MIRLDDLDAQAREGWRLGALHCTCDGYHQLWSLLRQAGVVGGTRLDAPILSPLLGELLADGADVLIAGAADGAQLELLAAAAAGRRLRVTVADRCAAPLQLITQLAPLPGVSVETLQADLSWIRRTGAWDLILSHSMLPFVAPEARPGLLRSLHAALRPQGRLVLVVRTSAGLSSEALAQHDAAWLAHARDRLSAVPLPGAPADVEARLQRYVHARRARSAALPTPEAAEALLRDAGFWIEQAIAGEESTALELDGRRRAARSYVFVAGAG